MKKDVIPRDASLRPDEDAWWEALAAREIDRMPVTAWDSESNALWPLLRRAYPSTRRRLLMQLLAKCDVPRQLLELIDREIDVSKAPRARIKDMAKFRAAARYCARNPDAPLAEVAVAVGMAEKNRTTIRAWKREPLFETYVSDVYLNWNKRVPPLKEAARAFRAAAKCWKDVTEDEEQPTKRAAGTAPLAR